MRRILVRLIVTIGVASAGAAPVSTQVAAVPPPAAPASEIAALIERYNLDRAALLRRYDVEFSPERHARLTKFYKDWQQQLSQTGFDPLGVEGRIDYTLLRARLDYELRLLTREQQWVSEASSLLPFAGAITGLLEARSRLESMDAAKTAGVLDRLSRDLEAAIKALESPNKPGGVATISDPARARQINAFRAAEILTSLRTDLTAWNRYYAGYDPMFTWWSAQPYAQADKALAAYIKALREKIVGYKEGEDEPIIGNPIGKAALVDDLASEFIPYSPDELLAIAEREFAWCDREMLKASRDMGFGDDWRAALEKVKTLHVEPGKQSDLVRDLAREAVEYVTGRDLVTVPPLADETWRMTMMSPERQKVNPFFLGGEVIQVSFPTDAMDHADKLMSMRGNNIHFSRVDGLPRADSRSRSAAVHDRPLQPASPRLRHTVLDRRMVVVLGNVPVGRRVSEDARESHRHAVLAHAPPGAHHLLAAVPSRQMTPQECIDFLVNRVGHERANAEAEVRRSFNGTYPPLVPARLHDRRLAVPRDAGGAGWIEADDQPPVPRRGAAGRQHASGARAGVADEAVAAARLQDGVEIRSGLGA